MMKLIIFGLLLVISTKNDVESVIFPNKQMSIVKNQGFFMYIVHQSTFKLEKCSLKLEDGTEFDLDPKVKEPFIYNTSEGVLIQRYSQNECGVRVKNVAQSLSGKWTLTAQGDRGSVESDSVFLEVLSNKLDPSPLVVTVTDENPYRRVKCPNNYAAKHCRVFDHNRDEKKDQCDFFAQSYGNETLYECRTMRWGEMQETQSFIKVLMEEEHEKEVKGKIIETDTHVILTCQDYSGLCRAEMPHKTRQLLLMDGLLMDRYSTYDTQINKGRCSIEIEKPLRPEDIGTWRIYHSEKDDSGCVFRVHDDSAVPQSNSRNPKQIEIWQNNVNALTIDCEVPFPIDYCYLSTPDFPDNENYTSLIPDQFFKSKFLGICRFTIKNPISGTYVCGVNNIDGGEDIQTYYQVKVFQVPAHSSFSQVTSGKGKSIDILVKTIFNYPIGYCRFMMPNGQIHGVSDKFRMEGNLRYYGKGLKYGECGVQVLKVTDEYYGVWKATIQVEGKEYHLEVVVTNPSGFRTAYVAGPILAVVAISGIVLAYMVYQKRSRHTVRRSRYDRTVGTSTDDYGLDNRSEASHES
uniref:CSON003013 protein n=1 Tax=Culicoides sonorensis TaxID=179676 RepID=A0A336MRI0_CULSO